MYASLLLVVCYSILPMNRRKWLSVLLGVWSECRSDLPPLLPPHSCPQNTVLCGRLLSSSQWKPEMAPLSRSQTSPVCEALHSILLPGPNSSWIKGSTSLPCREQEVKVVKMLFHMAHIEETVSSYWCLPQPTDMSPDRATCELSFRGKLPLHISSGEVTSRSVVAMGSGFRLCEFKSHLWSLPAIGLWASTMSSSIK